MLSQLLSFAHLLMSTLVRVSLSMLIVLWFEVKVTLSGLGIISKAFSRMTRISGCQLRLGPGFVEFKAYTVLEILKNKDWREGCVKSYCLTGTEFEFGKMTKPWR